MAAEGYRSVIFCDLAKKLSGQSSIPWRFTYLYWNKGASSNAWFQALLQRPAGPGRRRAGSNAQRQSSPRPRAMYFLAYLKLSDYDRAIDFFKARYARSSPEITLFVLLQWLRSRQREDLWQREYERAVQTGIEPRDSL